MRESMARLTPRFSANRTVREYTEQHYLPAATAYHLRSANRQLDPVSRNRLQDHPWVMRDVPQFGIQLPSHVVGSMIPKPARIQGEFRQRIEPLNFCE
jgi:hypothetical protein